MPDVERPLAPEAHAERVGPVAVERSAARGEAGHVEASAEIEAGHRRAEPVEAHRLRAGQREDAEFAGFEGQRRDVDAHALRLVRVAARAGGHGQEVVPPAGRRGLGTRREVELPVVPMPEGQAHRRVAAVHGVQPQRDVVGIMQDSDRREHQPQFAAGVLQAQHELLPRDVGEDPRLERPRRRRAAQGVGRPDVLRGVHPVVQVSVMGGAGVDESRQRHGVRKVRAGVERRRPARSVAEFAVQQMVGAQCLPERSAEPRGRSRPVRQAVDRCDEPVVRRPFLAAAQQRARVGEDGRGIGRSAAGLLIPRRVDVGRSAWSAAVFREPESVQGFLEQGRKVDLQSAPERVGQHAFRRDRGVGPESARGRFRRQGESARRGHGEIRQPPDARIERGAVMVGETRQQAQGDAAGPFDGQSTGSVLAGGARIAGVDPDLHAFVPDPVSIGPAGLVRQGDLRQGDASVRSAGRLRRGLDDRGHGVHGALRRGGTDQRDERRSGRRIVVLPRKPDGFGIIRRRIGGAHRLARIEGGSQRRRLGAGGPVVPSADQPGRRLQRGVVAPDAGPHRVAHAGPVAARLRVRDGEVGPRRGPLVRSGFLLQVGQRETDGGQSIEPRPRGKVMLRREPEFDGDEGGGGDHCQREHGHHRQRQHEAEAAARGGPRRGEGGAGGRHLGDYP